MKQCMWVIGANSDVARELILLTEKEYHITAAVRNIEAMKRFKEQHNLSELEIVSLDVCKKCDIDKFIRERKVPDIVVFAQGILENDKNVNRYLDEMVQCNYVSCIAIIESVWQQMLVRKSGCIVGITSVAADRGKASNKLYSSTKAAFSSYLQALMQEGMNKGVRVLDVKPGYIKSKMLQKNEKAYHSYLTASPERVAKKIVKYIKKKRVGTLYVKEVWRIIMFLIKCIPEKLYVRLNM